jgi:hypothetical protein
VIFVVDIACSSDDRPRNQAREIRHDITNRRNYHLVTIPIPYMAMKTRSFFVIVLAGLLGSSPLAAQWIRHSAAGVPRKADGTVDMSAPTPRTPDGKPDFSGIWTSDEVDPRRPNVPPNPHDATTSRRMINLGVDLPGGLPINPGSRRW